MFDGTNKAKFATWAQSIENAARLCNFDALNITLSKLQGAPLKSANYLEGKEINSSKQLSWTMIKQHLTTNYSEIPYDTHVIDAYDSLQQDMDESTEAYLHRAQDSLECIHHTNDMSSILAIGTNHTKILTGLKDGKLCNKVYTMYQSLRPRNGPTWHRFCKTSQTWQSISNGPGVTDYHLSKSTTHRLITIAILISITGPASHLQKRPNN